MVDVFISYAREDSERAAKIAQAFGNMGWSVWWDRRITVGQSYDQEIERELAAAKSVVVLWSKASTGSEWVRNEAAAGARRGVLIPAMLEDVQLPLEFSHKQTADLTDWNGDPAHAGFHALCDGIAAVLGSAASAPRLRPPSPARHWRRWVWIGIVIAVLGVGYGVSRRGAPSPTRTNDAASGELAGLVTGTYLGDIMSDSKGSSRSDVIVTVTRIGRTRVRVSSDNERIGTFEVELTRIGDDLFNVGGDSTFNAYPSKHPPEVALIARGEVSYGGKKR